MSNNFTIPGPILGYRASARRAFDPKYKAYKNRVRLLANQAGVPDDLGENDSAGVSIKVFWKKRARIDVENVLKAIVDAMWKRDRRVLFVDASAYENQKSEEAHVFVRMKNPI